MSEQQYTSEIKSMILSSLKTEYPATDQNKIALEKYASDAVIKLLQNEILFNEIAEQIKNYSYYQAENANRPKRPEIAKGFLNKIVLRDFTVGYIQKYEMKIENHQQTR